MSTGLDRPFKTRCEYMVLSFRGPVVIPAQAGIQSIKQFLISLSWNVVIQGKGCFAGFRVKPGMTAIGKLCVLCG